MERTIKNAVMEKLECDIDRENYGIYSTKRMTDNTFSLLAKNGIQICEDKVLKCGIEVANIERRYASRKSCGMYKELKPRVTWL